LIWCLDGAAGGRCRAASADFFGRESEARPARDHRVSVLQTDSTSRTGHGNSLVLSLTLANRLCAYRGASGPAPRVWIAVIVFRVGSPSHQRRDPADRWVYQQPVNGRWPVTHGRCSGWVRPSHRALGMPSARWHNRSGSPSVSSRHGPQNEVGQIDDRTHSELRPGTWPPAQAS